MGVCGMSAEWRMKFGYPGLAGLPGTLPWKLAPYLGRDPREVRRATEDFLDMRFAQVFPESSQPQRRQWARAHLHMLALEMMDGTALPRLGGSQGPSIELAGWEHVQALVDRRKGFIIVLSHFDRLMTSAVAFARKGLVMNALTMPVLDNPDLTAVQRRFLTRKINNLVGVIKGQYRSTSESLRPVHEGLLEGEVWFILADVWQPHFSRLRKHPFLGGEISLPTGIERLAKIDRRSTGACRHLLRGDISAEGGSGPTAGGAEGGGERRDPAAGKRRPRAPLGMVAVGRLGPDVAARRANRWWEGL
jgi:lauroyl/myristoyl acyltransferase